MDISYVSEFANKVSLAEMKAEKKLGEMRAIQKGNRLSITPVEAKEFKHLCKLGG